MKNFNKIFKRGKASAKFHWDIESFFDSIIESFEEVDTDTSILNELIGIEIPVNESRLNITNDLSLGYVDLPQQFNLLNLMEEVSDTIFHNFNIRSVPMHILNNILFIDLKEVN